MTTKEEREAFYDEEIAPVLLDLAKKCHEAGLSFLAHVAWSPEDVGYTFDMPAEGAGIKSLMVLWAMQAGGNADALIGKMIKHGVEHGHSSACLHLLGAKIG